MNCSGDTNNSDSAPSSNFVPIKLKKAPDAPKRFKSAFIFFSSEKHKEIRTQMDADGVAAKTSTIAKLVSEAWKVLPVEEREKWEAMARKDRSRYEMEKTMYTGPWKVPVKKRSLKDPTAPKRPMSAYLDFSNSRRGMVKRQNPEMCNAELSRLLATMWKEAPADVRKKYIDREYAKRQAYNTATASWKQKSQEEKRAKRELRENDAIRAVEASEQSHDANSQGRSDANHMKSESGERACHNTMGDSFSLQQQNQRLANSGTFAVPLTQAWPWELTRFFFVP